MEYYDNRYCISYGELIDGGIVTKSNYDNWVKRDKVTVVRQGKGLGNCALIAIDSIPEAYRKKIDEVYPGWKDAKLKAWIVSNYRRDQEAAAHYYSPEECGLTLKPEKANEYTVNASVLNTCIRLYENASAKQKLFGGEYNWEMMAGAIETLRERFGHTLPTSTLRFRKKVNEYKAKGYGCLISGKFGNQCARLLTRKEEKIIEGITVLENKPWHKNVHDMYEMFICGELDVFDPETGELMDPEEYAREKNGDLWVPSETTINNYLNRPATKLRVNRLLKPRMNHYHEDLPHVHRHNGSYALSQITMDDVDLSRRMRGNEMVHAYYAYDMVSQCILGVAYSRKKDRFLVEECFRDMFRLLKKRHWGIPLGIEVEHHLMSNYKEGLLKEGNVFANVRFCAPQNSQDKYAEPLNGAKKRSIIHKNHAGIGRFYGKGKWKVYYEKVSDETNQKWLDKTYYTFDELVADDRADNMEWNNSLHPEQGRYPGMSRWEVLIANINPGLRRYDEHLIARYIGEEVSTSIRRNSYVRVNHRDWWLSCPEVLEKLEPNNMKVTAYYLPNTGGEAENVYIHQGGRYIDKLEPIESFNRIIAEQTDEDREKFGRQMKKIKAFEQYLEKNKITRLGVMERDTSDGVALTEAETTPGEETGWPDADEGPETRPEPDIEEAGTFGDDPLLARDYSHAGLEAV
ncbi:MAG: hypothetical protein HDR98_01105 [Bacteroides sp.]|nr:hypothetical protein [Bacteroides sp.]